MNPLDDKEGKDFFLNSPEKLANPYPDFAYFREHKPVFYYEPLDSWFVFRFEDVEALFMDPRLSSKRIEAFISATPEELRRDVKELAPIFKKFVMMLDGEDHACLRKLLFRGFSHRVIDNLKEIIENVTNELLDAVQDRGMMDASREFAHVLPVAVISAMLGVPREDREHVKRWADDIADFFNDIPITVENTRRMQTSIRDMTKYVRRLIKDRRKKPKDDFLSELVHAEEEGKRLNEAGILSNSIVLLIAGHETTRNLIGNAIYLLLTHPEQLALLKADASLYKNAIEETLRFESVHPLMPRIAAKKFILHGHEIQKGQFVQLCIASANRDPFHFSNPDEYDITREHGKHLSFGIGPHFCLGAPLARKEAHIALEILFSRMPNLKLNKRKKLTWQRIANLRGPTSLPVVF